VWKVCLHNSGRKHKLQHDYEQNTALLTGGNVQNLSSEEVGLFSYVQTGFNRFHVLRNVPV